MKPVCLEVVIPTLSCPEMDNGGFGLIADYLGLSKKHRTATVSEYPEEWQEAVEYVGQWMRHLARLYRHRIRIQVIDAQSPLGVWKQIRHRVFRFPAFIVDSRGTYIGWDYQALESLIDQRIHGEG